MPSPSNGSIAENFATYFSVSLADSPALLHDVQRVRFNVYCDEFGYEDPGRFPDHLERDEYDGQSIHALIRHTPSAQPAGCVRMVPTLGDDPQIPLPFEKYCGDSLDRGFIGALGAERSTMCEISRLAVDGAFRRRGPHERESRFGQVHNIDFSPEERRTLPLIAVSAYLAATAITARTGHTNVFAMMEPFLPRLMSRSGINFSRAGADIEYHGTRAPYFITTDAALGTMNEHLGELYQVIERQLFPQT